MVDELTLHGLKSWFEKYVSGFASDDQDIAMNIELKKRHTMNVCIEIVDIANSIALNRQDVFLAEAVALLHDVGRFDQYMRYHTFDDATSENHAMLGAGILDREGVLEDIDRATRKLILDVVACHNRAELPVEDDKRRTFFLKLLRDADKIDIWRIVTQYYERHPSISTRSIELNLPDTPEISNQIVEALLAGRTARTKDMKTLNDFKLLQIGWVFDLNFSRTLQIAAGRRYLDRIRDTLPDSDIVNRVFRKAKAYLHAGFPA
ncbi:MAG: HD domain-containing protein [Chitinispirillaceae bacterium]|nr:HD domain-containing protein [Chitinispirillaceae bacterium]